MSDYTAKRIDEMEAAYGGGFVKARAELGVTSFGMQVIQMPRTTATTRCTTTPRAARRRCSSRSRGQGGSRLTGSALSSSPTCSCASARLPAQGVRRARGPAHAGARRRPRRRYTSSPDDRAGGREPSCRPAQTSTSRVRTFVWPGDRAARGGHPGCPGTLPSQSAVYCAVWLLLRAHRSTSPRISVVRSRRFAPATDARWPRSYGRRWTSTWLSTAPRPPRLGKHSVSVYSMRPSALLPISHTPTVTSPIVSTET